MKNFRLIGRITLASLMALGAATPAVFCQNVAPTTLHLEAENAKLHGPTVMTERAGFLGKGYVSDFSRDDDKITWILDGAKAGFYEVRIRYCSPFGEKGYDLSVNGAKLSAMFAPTGEKFVSTNAGKVELRAGRNTIVLEKGWGYYDIDALDFVPVTADAPLKPVPNVLADSQASAEAQDLMDSLLSTYGKKTLSGQYDTKENAYIRKVTGKLPAIKGGDLLEYSPSRLENGSEPGNLSEDLIADARKGQIITLSWHWNAPSGLYNGTYTNAEGKSIDAPWWRGFDADASTFDFQKALANTQSPEYKALLRDIDAIAVQLKKFEAAKVPVLWRPLHEAEGQWFWWGAKGPDAFKKLWQLTFKRLTQTHKLHNLIWVYTAGTKMDWYPGDKYVDIVGVDAYPSDASDPLSQTWDGLKKQFDGRKMMAISEFGKVPDVAKMHRLGEPWAYFVSWTGDLGPAAMPKEALSQIYKNSFVLNRDDLETK